MAARRRLRALSALLLLCTGAPIVAPAQSASGPTPIALDCVVGGARPEAAGFIDAFCGEAQRVLAARSGAPVRPLRLDELRKTAFTGRWVRIDITVRSPLLATGTMRWGSIAAGEAVEAGQAGPIEAGISDATLNADTAQLLVGALLTVSAAFG